MDDNAREFTSRKCTFFPHFSLLSSESRNAEIPEKEKKKFPDRSFVSVNENFDRVAEYSRKKSVTVKKKWKKEKKKKCSSSPQCKYFW